MIQRNSDFLGFPSRFKTKFRGSANTPERQVDLDKVSQRVSLRGLDRSAKSKDSPSHSPRREFTGTSHEGFRGFPSTSFSLLTPSEEEGSSPGEAPRARTASTIVTKWKRE
jgi:hypothetical protein